MGADVNRGLKLFAISLVLAGTTLAPSEAQQTSTGWNRGSEHAQAASQNWLDYLNDVRAHSGVNGVADNPAWSEGIRLHLRYLRLTPSQYRTGPYANAHTENPASPYYTVTGEQEGQRSNLILGGVANGKEALNVWLAAPFHAIGMLRPGLQEVAFAQDNGYAGLDVLGGLTYTPASNPVLFPGDGAVTTLTRFGGEVPNPVETCQHARPSANYSRARLPLVALLSSPPSPDLTASLKRPDGTTVTSVGGELCVVTRHTFYTSDEVYGSTGRSILEGDNAVILIPRRPLQAGQHEVTITEPSESPIAWSFEVEQPQPDGRIHQLVRPYLKGAQRVHSMLRINRGSWSPSTVTFQYRWLRNGRLIPKATSRTYTTRRRDRGDRIRGAVIVSHGDSTVVATTRNRILVK